MEQRKKFKKEEINIKKFMESEEYTILRKNMQEEINKYPVKIDKECFKKTEQEKIDLLNAKNSYKESRRNIIK